ncbi:YciI family protein [Micromonospora cathayae]|uniref:YciI family protein n=1 Tax=Micromonospora cathayae TaxID=3028804 RepID=A0ABY7ZKS1_9ACTN|nr:YciI family protein [Micromonospora sp. HUAS 3]WDZ83477.1 YciI family protein [Micromonospora sp. HUAS 3]
MAQYAIMIFERDTPGGWADLPEEVLEAHGRFPGQIEELGGKIVNGFALEPGGTATKIRGDVVADGPFVDSPEVLGGFFVIEARDLDHALSIAKLTPIHNGGVEVRPLLSE